MSLKRSKKVETADGFKQRQITDFFRKSASNRKFDITSNIRLKMPLFDRKLVDNSDEDFQDQVFMNESLPSHIFSNNEPGNLQASKKKRSKKKPPVMSKAFEDSFYDNRKDQVSMKSNLPVAQSSDNESKRSKSTKNEKCLNLVTPKSIRIELDKPPATEFGNLSSKKRKMEYPVELKDDQENRENIQMKCSLATPSSSTPVSSLTLNLTLNFEDKGYSENGKTNKASILLPHPFSSDDESNNPDESNNERKNEIGSIQVTPKSSPSKKRKADSENHKSHDNVILNRSKTISSPNKMKIKKSPISRGVASSSILSESNEMKTEEKFNMRHTEQLKILYEKIMEDEHKQRLLSDDNIDVIKKFLKMDEKYQYLITKMFRYLPKWYNMVNFCNRIKLNELLSEKEILKMYQDQKNDRFVDTDLSHLETKHLLYMLSVKDLKNIVKSLKFGKGKKGSKKDLVEYLLHNCKTQMTLIKKSSEDLLRDKAFKYLGNCVKLKDDIRSYFDKVYVLQTYSNMSYSNDIGVYLEDTCYFEVVYPKCVIDKMTPFKTKEQFSSYYKAFLMRKELDDTKLGNFGIKSLCEEVFEKLESIDIDAKWNRDLPAHLRKFSAEYLYIKILTKSIPKLSEYPQEVHLWLVFLMKNYSTSSLMGLWYKELARIRMSMKNYESAAETVIDGFESNNRNHNLNFLQLYELSLLSYKLRTTKAYNLPVLYNEKLTALEALIDIDKFPKNFINASTDRSGNKGKRIYSYVDENNEKIYTSVENLALKYYKEEENYEGIICEGRIISILFNLLFWDIIYEFYVEGTFISDLQNAPLDFYSSTFYLNRKDVIDNRLKEIKSEWELEKLEKTLKEKWNNLCQEKSIANSKGFDIEQIIIMFESIDRKCLSDIFERLVINYKVFYSGLPDLFLWREDEGQKVCKFVEVKGENDKLRPNQVLWIDYLLEAGVPVEVCHVSGVGAKKKFLKGVAAKNDLTEGQDENLKSTLQS